MYRYRTLFQIASSPPLRFYFVGDAGIEHGTLTTLALTARRSILSARSHPDVCLAVLFSIVNMSNNLIFLSGYFRPL
jgi:hypothetical protein